MPSLVRKTMPKKISAVGRSHLIAAAAAAALLCLAAVPAEARCSKRVTLYNASWCPYCKQVRAILARNHIRYSIKDATTARVQAVMLKRFGDTAVPRTVIGGVVVEGVDEARIKRLCRS
jgi:glutaredoxin